MDLHTSPTVQAMEKSSQPGLRHVHFETTVAGAQEQAERRYNMQLAVQIVTAHKCVEHVQLNIK